MGLFELFLIIIVIGIVVYCVRKYIPMDAEFKQIILVIGVIAVVFITLSAFGVIDYLRGIHVGRLR